MQLVVGGASNSPSFAVIVPVAGQTCNVAVSGIEEPLPVVAVSSGMVSAAAVSVAPAGVATLPTAR